jgi:hypothetical protein
MRCGTTYAATILDEHPEISVAKPIVEPELKFFLQEGLFRKGREFYEREYFANQGSAKIFGEKTVHYCEHEVAAKRISEWYPDARIIMLVRNPSIRAISNYLFSVKNGLETRSIHEVFVEHAPAPQYDKSMLISPFAYIERGYYLDQIDIFQKYFPSELIKVVISERLWSNKVEISSLFRFLDVDDSFLPQSISKKIFAGDVSWKTAGDNVYHLLSEYYHVKTDALREHLHDKIDEWNN